MEKFKTLNNHLCKSIINHACCGNYRAVYMLLYNCSDMITTELFIRLYNICFEIAPLTSDVYKTLPNEVKTYYNQLWLTQKKHD